MKKRNIDIFEKIVQAGEKIKEAREKRIKDGSESKERILEVDIQ